jgi:hypothetical protein
MKTVTISIDEAVDEQFRKEVNEHLGGGKGNLGRAVSEALRLWIDQVSQARLAVEMRELMHSGYEMGRLRYKKRADLYERA